MIVINKYKKHFKHLRILDGIQRLKGDIYLEAETHDGRYLSQILANDLESIEKQIAEWLPKRI